MFGALSGTRNGDSSLAGPRRRRARPCARRAAPCRPARVGSHNPVHVGPAGRCTTRESRIARRAPLKCSRQVRRPLRLSLTQRVRNSAARLRTRRDEPVSCGNSNKRPSRRRADHAPRRTCSLSASYCRANFCHRAACYSPTRPRDLCPNKAPQLWRSWRARLARTRWPVCRTQEPEPGLWRAARNALQSRGGDWVRHRGRNR